MASISFQAIREWRTSCLLPIAVSLCKCSSSWLSKLLQLSMWQQHYCSLSFQLFHVLYNVCCDSYLFSPCLVLNRFACSSILIDFSCSLTLLMSHAPSSHFHVTSLCTKTSINRFPWFFNRMTEKRRKCAIVFLLPLEQIYFNQRALSVRAVVWL